MTRWIERTWGVAVFTLAYLGFRWVAFHYDLSAIVVLTALFGMAAWVATPEARRMAAHVISALRVIDLSKQAAALSIGMTEAQASQQLNCHVRLDLPRWLALGPEFQRAFALQMLSSVGGVTVIENGLLASLVDSVADAFGARRVA